ncbi:MAG: CPBP family intramembrane metalloprotease [Candidatus Helarchaeota archaeon]|nr:CPBP family intramembrane metalloprotease [Candidatus Helarchaeota archaeon]
MPIILSPTGLAEPRLHVFLLLGAAGPLVGALLLTFVNEKREGLKRLWKKFWNFKIKRMYLIVSFLLFPMILGIAFLFSVVTEGVVPELGWMAQPWALPLWFFYYFIFAGVFEEFGWRGFLLDRLQMFWSAVESSIVLGAIWAFWHIPAWFITGEAHQGTSFYIFLIWVILLSILFTWIYNNTNGNLLVVVIFHAMADFTLFIFPLQTIFGMIYLGIITVIVILFIISIFGSKKLVREPVELIIQ